MKEKKINGFDKWDVQEWLHAMTTTADVKKDKAKLKAVNMLAAEQLKAAQEKKNSVETEAKVGKKMAQVFKG